MAPGLAQTRERIAEEQAALRRVALLVARAASPEEVFAAVSEETGRVLGSDSTGIFRFDDGDDTATVVARWGENEATVLPVGLVIPLDADSVIIRVRATSGPARVDTYEGLAGATADEVRPTGLRSSVAAPIEVGAHLGALAVGTFKPEPFPEDTPDRLAAFAELASLAIASAAAREQLLDSRARLVRAADAERRCLVAATAAPGTARPAAAGVSPLRVRTRRRYTAGQTRCRNGSARRPPLEFPPAAL